jgi:hypothetical protein
LHTLKITLTGACRETGLSAHEMLGQGYQLPAD